MRACVGPSRANICCCIVQSKCIFLGVAVLFLLLCFVFYILWSIAIVDKQNRFVHNNIIVCKCNSRRRMWFKWRKSVHRMWNNLLRFVVRIVRCGVVCCGVMWWRVPGISASIRFETIKLYLELCALLRGGTHTKAHSFDSQKMIICHGIARNTLCSCI